MIIEKEKLRIRTAKPKDAKKLCDWWNDGKVMAHAGFPNGLGIKESRVLELIEENNEFMQRMIIELDNSPIGEMSYRTKGENIAEIGIKICDATRQNKGLGKEYIGMLISYLFLKMNYKKIIINTNLKNERAQHVYEKLGFRKIRTNINSWKDQLGELQSSVDYEIARKEYHERYSKSDIEFQD